VFEFFLFLAEFLPPEIHCERTDSTHSNDDTVEIEKQKGKDNIIDFSSDGNEKMKKTGKNEKIITNLNNTNNQSADSDSQTIDLYNSFYASENALNSAYNSPNTDPLFENNANTRTKNLEKLNFLTKTETESENKKEKKNIFDGNNVNKKPEITVIKENICDKKLTPENKIKSLLSTSQFEEIRF
jgi:hypothetical protein